MSAGDSEIGLGIPFESDNALRGDEFNQPLERLISKPPIVISGGQTVREAVRLMQDNDVSAVMVTFDDRVVGILTERDVVHKLVGVVDNFLDEPVSVAMTREPITLQEKDSIVHVAHNMQVGGYRHVPIVDPEGRPRSIISIKDVVRFVLDHFPDEVLNTLPEPHRGPRRIDGG